MNIRLWIALLVGGLAVGAWTVTSQATARPRVAVEVEAAASPEVLTRGPVHEAFLSPVQVNPEPTVVVSQPPPEAITEYPPEEAPDADAVWVPGYWAWDDDTADFLWVSGCWRVPPAGSTWVPGYWAQVEDGFQWVGGFWQAADIQETEYLPAPPDSLDEGPIAAAPSEDVIWVPGCWIRESVSFVWQRGRWIEARIDRVWVPAHYVWTPRGCLFIAGYWDYTLDHRGLLFAPVSFHGLAYRHVGFVFSPSIVINVAVLQDNLFCNPRHDHFYFGDYYAAPYVRAGIRPWFEFRTSRAWYDPVYVHQVWSRRRTDPQWDRHNREAYTHRQADRNARPARTFRDLQTQVARLPARDRKGPQLAQPLSVVAAGKATPFRFQELSKTRRTELARNAKAMNDFAKQRTEKEGIRTKGPQRENAQAPKFLTPKGTSPRTLRDATPIERTPVRRDDEPRRTVKPVKERPETAAPPTVIPRERKTTTPPAGDRGTLAPSKDQPDKAAPRTVTRPAAGRTLIRPTERPETVTPNTTREVLPNSPPTRRRTVMLSPTDLGITTPSLARANAGEIRSGGAVRTGPVVAGPILPPSKPVAASAEVKVLTPPTSPRIVAPPVIVRPAEKVVIPAPSFRTPVPAATPSTPPSDNKGRGDRNQKHH